MKVKVILFDIDGVLIRMPHYFSHELERQGYKNATSILNDFFMGKYKNKYLRGETAMEKAIVPYLKKLGWESSAKKFLEIQFQYEEKFLDKNLISFIKDLQKKGVQCYLGTDQSKIRAKFFLNKMNFKNIFDGYFVSCYVGKRKTDNKFWEHTIEKLERKVKGIKPEEIVFFDDIQKNVDTALKFGIKAFLFENVSQLKKDLKKLS